MQGQLIKKGQMLLLPLGSMHRDPEAFENPETFDIQRDQKNNVVFGLGPHYCMGATIARAQGEVAYEILCERFPNWEIDGDIRHNFVDDKISELWIRTNV